MTHQTNTDSNDWLSEIEIEIEEVVEQLEDGSRIVSAHKAKLTPEAAKAIQSKVDEMVRLAEIKMADNLIDQERKLYKVFGDDNKICTGIKIMADEVREYYEEGKYALSTNKKGGE